MLNILQVLSALNAEIYQVGRILLQLSYFSPCLQKSIDCSIIIKKQIDIFYISVSDRDVYPESRINTFHTESTTLN